MHENRSYTVSKILSYVLALAVGLGCGLAMVQYLSRFSYGVVGTVLTLLVSLAFLALAILCQTLIHELGHWLFGLISGYELSSLRIGRFAFVKGSDGKLLRKQLPHCDSFWECLMSPPDMEEDGYLPTGLYCMGGVILNAFTAVIFLWAYFVSGKLKFLPVFFIFMSILGVGFALMNWLPLNMDGDPNDGYISRCLRDDDDAIKVFWSQLKIQRQLALGTGFGDMPEEWFFLPSPARQHNSLYSAAAASYEERQSCLAAMPQPAAERFEL